MPVEVGSANVEGVSLTIRGGVPVTGRVRVEGETTVEPLARAPEPAAGRNRRHQFGPMPTQQLKEDGTFQLDDVAADRYMVSVNGLPDGFYVKSVRSANVDVTAQGPRRILRISRAARRRAEPQRRPGYRHRARSEDAEAGAHDDGGHGSPGEGAARSRTLLPHCHHDLSGQFTFKSVPPGEYRVYSWEEVDYGAWMDPDFLKPLESRGEPVSLQEGARVRPFRST